MILDISIDPETGVPTVEGIRDHRLGTNGGVMLFWRCEPGQGHKSWKVQFEESPFESGKKEFSGSKAPDGDRLATRDMKAGEKSFKYSVSCTDRKGETHEADPEVVIWPI